MACLRLTHVSAVSLAVLPTKGGILCTSSRPPRFLPIYRQGRVKDKFPVIGRRKLLSNARRIIKKADQAPLILLAMEDITDSPSAKDAGGRGKEKS